MCWCSGSTCNVVDGSISWKFFVAVQNKSRERAARAARAKPELTSCPDKAAPGCPDR